LVKNIWNDTTVFQGEVNRLTTGAKTTEEKIKAIYYWVQDNIKYIAFEDGLAGFKPTPAHEVYTNRYGDCKGMANLTAAMLKSAGFDSRLTWIGTNHLPYSYDIPSLAVDNHMICTVFADGKEYILDATVKFSALGSNGEHIQGKQMLIENGNAFLIKKVPVSDYNANLVSRSEKLRIDGNTLNGSGQISFNGRSKVQIMYMNDYGRIDDRTKLYNNLAVSDYLNTDVVTLNQLPPMDREKPLELKYSYILNNKLSAYDKEVYIDLDWDKYLVDAKIEDDRRTDFYFERKVRRTTTKNLVIPPDYKVAHLPAGMSRKNAEFTFKVSYTIVGNEVVYSNEIIVNEGLVRKKSFKEWNECIQELKDIYNDQVVITKLN
jgi:Transglutaminase-like superfamily